MSQILSKTKTEDSFGKWIVLERAPNNPNRNGVRFLCKCECGTIRIIRADALRRGASKSCGCKPNGRSTHRLSMSAEYQTWSHMRRRCNNPNDASYSRYGGRGITVCRPWDESFESFYKDMGPKPSPTHSLDRIDNDGNYEPDNCRWATPQEQAKNRTSTKLITINDETKCLADWLNFYGRSRTTYKDRINRGWDVINAIVLNPSPNPINKRRNTGLNSKTLL